MLVLWPRTLQWDLGSGRLASASKGASRLQRCAVRFAHLRCLSKVSDTCGPLSQTPHADGIAKINHVLVSIRVIRQFTSVFQRCTDARRRAAAAATPGDDARDGAHAHSCGWLFTLRQPPPHGEVARYAHKNTHPRLCSSRAHSSESAYTRVTGFSELAAGRAAKARAMFANRLPEPWGRVLNPRADAVAVGAASPSEP